MTFAQTISNEQVAALPAIQYNGQIVVVETPQALAEACEPDPRLLPA